MLGTLVVAAIWFAGIPAASAPNTLRLDKDVISAVVAVGNPCVQYALRTLREDETGYRKTHTVEGDERLRVWRGITYTRHFEACVAEVAAELSKTSGFDHEQGNETLKHLSPLYHPGAPMLAT